jgi:mannosyl-oligosaccharide alpha-1,2-mannosidase
MEFTRLAQLTGNDTYYDAITRIVDELEAWQDHTLIPGIWPADIDSRGCSKDIVYKAPARTSDGAAVHNADSNAEIPIKKPAPLVMEQTKVPPNTPSKPGIIKNGAEALKIPKPDDDEKPTFKPKADASQRLDVPFKGNSLNKRDNIRIDTIASLGIHGNMAQSEARLECAPAGLQPLSSGAGKYTFGSTADSAFEYLSKQYILLGGQVENYRTMFEKALDAGNKHLIYRVMIPDEKREVLVSGAQRAWTIPGEAEEVKTELDAEGQHLTCFVGGMYAMGAKLFERPEWLELGAKLTDGCVWAYESMASGIMPETFQGVPCESRQDCAWNETKWQDALDPNHQIRLSMYQQQMTAYEEEVEARKNKKKVTTTEKKVEPKYQGVNSGPIAKVTAPQDSARAPPAGFDMEAKRRQMDANRMKHPKLNKRDEVVGATKASTLDDDYVGDKKIEGSGPVSPTKTTETTFTPPEVKEEEEPPIWSPTPPATRDEYVKSRMENERLPKGMKMIGDTRYLLR